MKLDEVKAYLHIDADITDDDAVLRSFILAGERYLESATDKAYDDTDELMKTYIKLYVKQLYETRNDALLEKSLDAILTQIKISSDFESR